MKKLVLASTPLLIGVILMVISAFTPSTIQEDGMLYEPFFFLIPISALFIFIGIISLLIVTIMHIKSYKKG